MKLEIPRSPGEKLMEAYHDVETFVTNETARLAEILRGWVSNPDPRGFASFEQSWRDALMEVERRGVGLGMTALDVDVPEIEVAGVAYKRGGSTPGTYIGLAGRFTVERHLYTPVDGTAATKSICPVELLAGIVEGTWTPCAAEVMAHSVAVMTPYEAEKQIAMFRGFTPSRSSLERLPKALSDRWESHREAWEEAVRGHELLPFEATTATVSLDGVMVPMRAEVEVLEDSAPSEAQQELEPKKKRKVVYREAACGTVSLYTAEGDRLETAYFGRMPESKKPTLHAQLQEESGCLLRTNPDLRFVFLADGALENWRILDDIEEQLRKAGIAPQEIERIVDFYHAAEHLKSAVDLYYSSDAAKARGVYEELRHKLRHDDDGVDQVVRKLTYFRNRLRKGTKARKSLTTELAYFRSRRGQMRYAEFTRKGLPIGTGVTEAACKTLVVQRMKRSGMQWAIEGGQAVMTLRSLMLSNRWAPGWKLLSGSYRAEVLKVRRKGHLRVIETLRRAS